MGNKNFIMVHKSWPLSFISKHDHVCPIPHSSPQCSWGISNAAAAVCIRCEFQLWCVWIIGIQSAESKSWMCWTESTHRGLLKYTSPSCSNCSLSCLGSSAYFPTRSLCLSLVLLSYFSPAILYILCYSVSCPHIPTFLCPLSYIELLPVCSF